jgi:2-dehydro-3-deoxy-D-arabinonate dehydratase
VSEPIRVFRYRQGDHARLGIAHGDQLYDLSMGAGPISLADWLSLPDPAAALREAVADRPALPVSLAQLQQEGQLLPPLDQQEVWAAGVTYLRSKVARMEESEGGGSFYDRVYDAERPEIFLKATPSRVVGPGGDVRIRTDSRWNVPEPELALVISPAGRLVGYTLGNDMSSRDIEGENPLYLPQAKVYCQSCALGPAILVEQEQPSHREFPLRLRIERGGQAVFEGETSTGQMKRQFHELIEYLMRDNLFPDGAFLLTGTGIVPPDDFTLEPGDRIEIASPEIGVLRNQVVRGR